MNMSNIDATIQYYNQNAKDFYTDTVSRDMSTLLDRFLSYLEENAYILDFGCGSGRDTKYFLEKGYLLDAVDGSAEMCRIASRLTGIEVRHMYFHELEEKDKYDGIWACASILHVPYESMVAILQKLYEALKDDGVLYLSFKYGDFEGMRNGRWFTNMNEDRINRLLCDVPLFVVMEMWTTQDVRPDRKDEKWLNCILKKRK